MDNPNDRFGAATYVRRDCAYTLPGMAKKRTMVARRAVLIAAPLAGLFALGGRGFGQEFPTGPITFVVAFPPGGSIDVVMRAMAPKLQERLGKPVVIENRVGAGGNIAAAAVANAPPDGHTLLAPASSLAANPTLIRHMPFDTLKDLQGIALLFRTPLALVVHPSVPAKSVSELIALLKQKPGEITLRSCLQTRAAWSATSTPAGCARSA